MGRSIIVLVVPATDQLANVERKCIVASGFSTGMVVPFRGGELLRHVMFQHWFCWTSQGYCGVKVRITFPASSN